MRKLIYISFLWLSVLSSAFAQEKKYVYQDSSLIQKEEEGTPSQIEVVEVPATDEAATKTSNEQTIDTVLYANNLSLPIDSIQNWRNQKAFEYSKYLDSLLKAKQDKEKGNVQNDPASSGPSLFDQFLSLSFTQIFLWTLAIFFILFIIYRLFLTQGAFRRESRSAKSETPEVVEELITSETDFDAMISQALRNSNYRQAVRYQYLKTIHKLADKKFIELAPDKTNYQYVREISRPDLQNDFASLTLNYEYVWYGEFAIETNIYQKIESNFIGFNQKL